MSGVKKLLVIITTYNPGDKQYNESFEDFSHVWFDVIRSWQMQRSGDLHVDIIVADNVSGPKSRAKLLEFQQKTNGFHIDFVDEIFTTPFVPFNHAMSLFKDKEVYDYYAFCSSDAYFRKKGDLQILLHDMGDNCGHISCQVDYDMVQRFDYNIKKQPTRIHLGEGANMHLGIWTREFMEAYDFKYFDIFGGRGTEGLFPYACAAIKRTVLLSHKVFVHHKGWTDRMAYIKVGTHQPVVANQYRRDFCNMLEEGVKVGMGFMEGGENWEYILNRFLNEPTLGPVYLFRHVILGYIFLTDAFRKRFDRIKHLNIIPKEIIGFIECQDEPYIRRHNPDCFDRDGFPKNDDLYHFMKENLFLTKEELDYEKIPHEFHPPQ